MPRDPALLKELESEARHILRDDSGTGKRTRGGLLARPLASVRLSTTAALVTELIEAQDEKKLPWLKSPGCCFRNSYDKAGVDATKPGD